MWNPSSDRTSVVCLETINLPKAALKSIFSTRLRERSWQLEKCSCIILHQIAAGALLQQSNPAPQILRETPAPQLGSTHGLLILQNNLRFDVGFKPWNMKNFIWFFWSVLSCFDFATSAQIRFGQLELEKLGPWHFGKLGWEEGLERYTLY